MKKEKRNGKYKEFCKSEDLETSLFLIVIFTAMLNIFTILQKSPYIILQNKCRLVCRATKKIRIDAD